MWFGVGKSFKDENCSVDFLSQKLSIKLFCIWKMLTNTKLSLIQQKKCQYSCIFACSVTSKRDKRIVSTIKLTVRFRCKNDTSYFHSIVL